jgi:hypothetical protein
LNDKTAFDKWAISDSGKNKNKNELSDADFKIEIKSIQDNADNENNADDADKGKYKLVKINEKNCFLYNKERDIQFILPRSEYFELFRRVQTLHPYYYPG